MKLLKNKKGLKSMISKKYILLLILLSSLVSASFITMQTTTSITTSEESIQLNISTINKGDEPAYNVQFIADIDGKKATSEVKQRLEVDEKFVFDKLVKNPLEKKGTYPLILTTKYEDANGYPFSAISVSTFANKEASISEIAAKLEAIELSDKGIMKLTVKNTGKTEKDLNIRLVTAKELTINNDEFELNLASKEEKTIEFEIESFSALPGSTYPIYSVIEYEEDDMHFTESGNGTVRVVEKKGIFNNQILLISALVVLLVVFIGFQFKKKK